jgi:hypothetical protein
MGARSSGLGWLALVLVLVLIARAPTWADPPELPPGWADFDRWSRLLSDPAVDVGPVRIGLRSRTTYSSGGRWSHLYVFLGNSGERDAEVVVHQLELSGGFLDSPRPLILSEADVRVIGAVLRSRAPTVTDSPQGPRLVLSPGQAVRVRVRIRCDMCPCPSDQYFPHCYTGVLSGSVDGVPFEVVTEACPDGRLCLGYPTLPRR